MEGDARQIVREGKVVAVFPERHTARVCFEDKDDMTSDEMPVLTLCSSGNKFYALPDVGTTVVCLFAGNGGQTGTGFIIGSRFHDKAKPNANSIDKTRMDFDDDTFVEYDRKTHELKISCSGKITIEAKDKITFKSKDDIAFDADGEIDFKGAKSYSLTATQDVIIKGERIQLN